MNLHFVIVLYMSYFSTLGYSPNPLLDAYQKKFLLKLRSLWALHIPGEIPNDAFLLTPDFHSLLLVGINSLNGDGRRLLVQVQQEWEKQNMLQWEKKGEDDIISWTQIRLTLDFINPEAYNYWHPSHKERSVGITFGSISSEAWRKLFAESFAIVEKVSPGFMDEIDHVISKIIPFDVSSQVHNSWSYSNAIGHLLMSYPVDMDKPELAVLEAILHEYNHNKLNLVMQTETLILNDFQERYYSPYRPDARHIHGIYLWLHALTGAYWVIIHAYCQRIIDLPENWVDKCVLYILKNWLSLQVLDKYAVLTPLGKSILEEMRSVHMQCLTCIKEANISPVILRNVREELRNHFESVKKNYPELLS